MAPTVATTIKTCVGCEPRPALVLSADRALVLYQKLAPRLVVESFYSASPPWFVHRHALHWTATEKRSGHAWPETVLRQLRWRPAKPVWGLKDGRHQILGLELHPTFDEFCAAYGVVVSLAPEDEWAMERQQAAPEDR